MVSTPACGIVGAGGHRWAAFSETGARPRNEDRWGVREGTRGLAVWALADGMGGHDDGDVAATVSVDAFLESAAAQDTPKWAVCRGMSAARQAVAILRGADAGSHAPSSTLVGLAVKGRIGFVCHAGDSVLFQFRAGRLIHRTCDHNVRELKRTVSGLVPQSVTDDPDASKLTRSVGDPLQGDAEDTITRLDLRAGDLLLLCSDGVSQHIPADDPGEWAAATSDEVGLLEHARRSVDEARQARQDNYTAVAIQFGGAGVITGLIPRQWPLAVASLVVAVVIAYGQSNEQARGPPETDSGVARPGLPTLASKRGVPPVAFEKQTATQAEVSSMLGPSIAPAPAVPKASAKVTPTPASPNDARNPPSNAAAKPCRTVFERQEECTIEQRAGKRCRRESRSLEFEGAWPGDEHAPSIAEAESACRTQVHEFTTGEFEGQCDGSVGEVFAACTCKQDVESEHRHHCEARASASCFSIREVCEDIVVPRRRCRAIRIATQVCD